MGHNLQNRIGPHRPGRVNRAAGPLRSIGPAPHPYKGAGGRADATGRGEHENR